MNGPDSAQKRLESLFDALYSRLILRDLFGKIMPGVLPLAAIGIAVGSLDETKAAFSALSLGAWLILFGESWLMGFAVQAFGERWHWFSLYVKAGSSDREGLKDDTAWIEQRDDFLNVASDLERQQAERFRIIKEACGNGYVAIYVSLAILLADAAVDHVLTSGLAFDGSLLDSPAVQTYGVGIIAMIGVAELLRWMHVQHVWREYRWIARVIRIHPPTTEAP